MITIRTFGSDETARHVEIDPAGKTIGAVATEAAATLWPTSPATAWTLALEQGAQFLEPSDEASTLDTSRTYFVSAHHEPTRSSRDHSAIR